MPKNRSTSPTRDRVLTWHRHGWGAYEIADKIGVSPQTVYYWLHQLEDAGEISNGVKRYRPRAS